VRASLSLARPVVFGFEGQRRNVSGGGGGGAECERARRHKFQPAVNAVFVFSFPLYYHAGELEYKLTFWLSRIYATPWSFIAPGAGIAQRKSRAISCTPPLSPQKSPEERSSTLLKSSQYMRRTHLGPRWCAFEIFQCCCERGFYLHYVGADLLIELRKED